MSGPAAVAESFAALFPQVLGPGFATLPPTVRRLHLTPGAGRWHGEAVVERGRHPLARLFAWLTHLPPAGTGPVVVEIDAADGRERWVRRIGGRPMPSRLWAGQGTTAGLLCERLGAVLFGFAMRVEDDALVWRVAHVRVLGWLPLPARAFAGVVARESERDGRYRFDVRAAMPVAGLLVHYRGWLEVP